MTNDQCPINTNEGKKILRIVDVNANRAMEGLRVVEEICRFILEDQKLTAKVKKARGDLLKSTKALEGPLSERRMKARKALADVGRKMYTKMEGKRQNIGSVFRANIKRAQEAVRCLEEFSKLFNLKHGRSFKDARFKLYELEKNIAKKLSQI